MLRGIEPRDTQLVWLVRVPCSASFVFSETVFGADQNHTSGHPQHHACRHEKEHKRGNFKEMCISFHSALGLLFMVAPGSSCPHPATLSGNAGDGAAQALDLLQRLASLVLAQCVQKICFSSTRRHWEHCLLPSV